MQYDTAPVDRVYPHRDTSIRVLDPSQGLVEFFDVETGTSLATRILIMNKAQQLLKWSLAFMAT